MSGNLPASAAERNEYPLADGLLYYFPAALAAVARVSKIGNDQHNPGEPMHWARGKSTDHANKILRHQLDAGTLDSDGTRHSAKVAWRALAQLQEELEREEGAPLPRNARLDQPTSGSRPNQPEDCNPASMREAKIAYDVACDGKLQRDWPTPQRLEKVAAGNPATVPGYPIEGVPPERVPKWDPRWAAEQSRDGVLKDIRDYGSAFVRHTWEDGRLVVTHVPLENVYVANPTRGKPPNCDGLSARDIRSPHPMAAEALREFERDDNASRV